MVDENNADKGEELAIISLCSVCNSAIKENNRWKKVTPEAVEAIETAIKYLAKYDDSFTHSYCSPSCIATTGFTIEEAREICENSTDHCLE